MGRVLVGGVAGDLGSPSLELLARVAGPVDRELAGRDNDV
jgi:hypothetical protein